MGVGSRIYVAGMDNPQKALSSERDFIYANQAEEFLLADWEILSTRCTGRAANMPFPQMLGDCNPGPPGHWIRQRPSITFLESRHEDNPTLYDEAGIITERGKITMAVLDALTGVRYQRLRLGKWVSAEGQVYEEWDRAVHLLSYNSEEFPYASIPEDWRRFRAVDFGYTNPFVCHWWAIDGDGRLYLYRQIYRTRRLVQDHASQMVQLSEQERIETTVTDHDAEDAATLRAYGVPTTPAIKAISTGIEAVQARLRRAGDGKPRIFVMEGSLADRDEELAAIPGKPWCTEQEFETYVWPKGIDGKPLKEVPVDLDNHGMDTLRYMVAHQDLNLLTPMRGSI